MNEHGLATLCVILAIALFFAVLRIVRGPDREVVAQRELEAKRWRAVRDRLRLDVDVDGDVLLVGDVVSTGTGVVLSNHVPFLASDQIAALNGNADPHLLAGDAVDRAADWFARRLGTGG